MKNKSTKNSYFLDIYLVKIAFCMIIIEIMKKTSEIYTLGTQFYYRMKLFWSSCFDKKISMIGAPVQKLRFFRRKIEQFGRFQPFLVYGFI